ncbi:hypothetical protein F4801DRAFT_105816 [Xylaria longipes]|nr:hypothetical protein F4801DRAFT_105816 [Xylaria longipes]
MDGLNLPEKGGCVGRIVRLPLLLLRLTERRIRAGDYESTGTLPVGRRANALLMPGRFVSDHCSPYVNNPPYFHQPQSGGNASQHKQDHPIPVTQAVKPTALTLASVVSRPVARGAHGTPSRKLAFRATRRNSRRILHSQPRHARWFPRAPVVSLKVDELKTRGINALFLNQLIYTRSAGTLCLVLPCDGWRYSRGSYHGRTCVCEQVED